ncbi:MAG: dienelactone hydrolase family protein [Candidatus Acidiferrum sp.]
MSSKIQLTASDGHSLDAYVAGASTSAEAIVVIQEIFGVNRHIRAITDDYANQGYTALAPALFDRVQRGIELNYNSADASRGMQIATQIGIEKALLDVAAAIEYAGKAVPGKKKVGVVGYCFGGTLAWLAATRLYPAAAVGYYGGQITRFAAEQPHCPVLLHFGSRDTHIPASEIEKIQKAHPEVPVYLYDAGHGFNCDQRPDYEPRSATLARQRTLEFFKQHLLTES